MTNPKADPPAPEKCPLCHNAPSREPYCSHGVHAPPAPDEEE